MLKKINNIHFTGIGGAGMSGLAEVLRTMGFSVSGSDRASGPVTRRLQKMGVRVRRGHRATNIGDADIVVYSAAVPLDNPELARAREKRIPVMRRAEMLGEILRLKPSVGVSGTHGKTTTTSMIGHILEKAGQDPTLIVGGIVKHIGGGAKVGGGNIVVAEADEYNRSFLEMYPTLAVITTVEADHLDCYDSLEAIKDAFVEFANHVPFWGCVIACLDEVSVQSILPRFRKQTLTYGFSRQANYRAADADYRGGGSAFKVYISNKLAGPVELPVPGEHNIKNALAALAVAGVLGVSFAAAARALRSFASVRRRFEIKGTFKGITVVDDYAHHPTEIQATLEGARSGYPNRIVAVFQPHLYTRTRDLYREFGLSFSRADKLIVTDVYAAREKPLPGITGELIADAARASGHQNVVFVANRDALPRYLARQCRPGDMVIMLGAGDIDRVTEKFIKTIKAKS
jgi:UDP-N-acetylmuramate--alanine ligase